MKSHLLAICLVVFAVLPLIGPFVSSGHLQTDDGNWAIIRLAEMHREVKDLQIPPQWAGYLNHGYGYPLFLFTYPFPFYVAELIHLIGFGVINAMEITFVLAILGAASAMYFFLYNEFRSSVGALLGAVVYSYAPFHLVDLYYRGSIGESLAFMFFPLLFLLAKKCISRPAALNLLLFAITTAAFMLNHNVMVVLLAPFLGIWIVYLLWQVKFSRMSNVAIVSAGTIGLALSAYFWLPAFVEKKYIALSLRPLFDRTSQFLSLPQIIGISLHDPRLPYQLGVITFCFMVGGALVLFLQKKRLMATSLFIGMVGLSLFMILPLSAPLWQVPLFREIDFPWRMFAVSSFLGAFLASGILSGIPGKLKSVTAFILILLVIFGARSFIKATPQLNVPDAYYETNDATTTVWDELMPIWVQQKPANRQENQVLTVPNSGEVVEYIERSHKISFIVINAHPTTVTVQKVYFPGWRVFANNKEVLPVTPSKETGLLTFDLAQGENHVQLKFTPTPIRSLATLVSMIGLGSCIGLIVWSKKLFPYS